MSLGLVRESGPMEINSLQSLSKSQATPCVVCADLEPEVAFRLMQTRKDSIWCHKHSPWDAKKIPIPSWASEKREDLAAYELSTSTDKIKTAARGGCLICKALVEGLRKYVPGPRDQLAIIIFCLGNVLRLRVGALDNGEDSETQLTELEFYTDPEDKSDLGQKIGSEIVEHCPRKESYPHKGATARTIAVDSDSDECWSQIASWIQECATDHFLCGSQATFMAMPITSSQTLPKRVIDIGDKEDNSGIQLFESKSSSGVYLALSHAWGNSLPIKTTKNTIKRWKKNIPWNNMSKTFQDAIRITRKLGVRYLWIDTLCIIQDDKTDWEIEAANMSKIYQDALVVISATLSTDGSGGCHSERETSTEIIAVNKDGTHITVFVRPKLSHEAFWQSESFSTHWDKDQRSRRFAMEKRERDLTEHPVLQRAWCFQERLLGRRTLHYTKHELVWECVQTTHCECGVLRYSLGANNSIRRRMNLIRFDHSDPRMNRLQSGGNSTPWWLPEEWKKIIGQYSFKHLGYATDTLPALAGLASNLASGDGRYLGKYLAGLWERDIDSYVGWMPLSKKSVRPRDRADCDFPSWSWASIDTPFYWPSWGTEETTMRCFAVTGNDIGATSEQLPSTENQKRGFWNFISTTLWGRPKPKSPVITVTMTPRGYSISMPKISYSKWTGGALFLKGKVIEVTLTGMDDSRDVHAAFLKRDEIECSFIVDRRPQCLGLIGQAVHLMRLTQVTAPKEPSGVVKFQTALPESLAFVLLQVQGGERTFRRIGMLQGLPDEWVQYEGDEFEEFTLV